MEEAGGGARKTCGGELRQRRIAFWRPAPKGFRVIFSGCAESMMQVIINESGALLQKALRFYMEKERRAVQRTDKINCGKYYISI